jgi:hypothetical protein
MITKGLLELTGLIDLSLNSAQWSNQKVMDCTRITGNDQQNIRAGIAWEPNEKESNLQVDLDRGGRGVPRLGEQCES